MKIDVLKVCKVIVLLAVIGSAFCFIQLWLGLSRERTSFRQRIKAMTPAEADKVSLDLMAAMINASQTNWNVIVIPRTNL